MDQKKKLILTAAVFAVVLAAAFGGYRYFSKQVKPEQLSIIQDPGEIESAKTEEELIGNDLASNEETAVDEEGKEENTEENEGTESELVTAPDFTVLDQEGNIVKLSDFFGAPIVLNFWASWCPPCKSEMPEFQEISQALKGDVQFLMVNLTDNVQETVETAAAYVEEQGYTFPVLYDTEQEAAYTYGLFSIPVTYFLDEEGKITAAARGAIDRDTLLEGIHMISDIDLSSLREEDSKEE